MYRILCTVITLVSSAANAAVVSVQGDVQQVAPLASVRSGDSESDVSVRVFQELSGMVIPQDFQVNITSPGFHNEDALSDTEIVSGGIPIDSFFFHFDPVGNPDLGDPAIFLTGTVEFSRPIVGIITSDVLLDQSEGAGLRSASTMYPNQGETPGRGMDPLDVNFDFLEVSSDLRSVSFSMAARTPGDQIRVLTATAIPEPSTYLLLLLATGLSGIMLRRR